MDNLSHDVDDWLDNHMVTNAVWCAVLSNGVNVIEDDERPGRDPVSSWTRLGVYCQTNKLFIKEMKIKFRTNEIHLDVEGDAVFFCKSLLAGISSKNTFSYLTGTLREGILKVVKWRVPDLTASEFIDGSMVSYRDPEKSEECLIRKPNV
jgi:hypothetical protein